MKVHSVRICCTLISSSKLLEQLASLTQAQTPWRSHTLASDGGVATQTVAFLLEARSYRSYRYQCYQEPVSKSRSDRSHQQRTSGAIMREGLRICNVGILGWVEAETRCLCKYLGYAVARWNSRGTQLVHPRIPAQQRGLARENVAMSQKQRAQCTRDRFGRDTNGKCPYYVRVLFFYEV